VNQQCVLVLKATAVNGVAAVCLEQHERLSVLYVLDFSHFRHHAQAKQEQVSQKCCQTVHKPDLLYPIEYVIRRKDQNYHKMLVNTLAHQIRECKQSY